MANVKIREVKIATLELELLVRKLEIKKKFPRLGRVLRQKYAYPRWQMLNVSFGKYFQKQRNIRQFLPPYSRILSNKTKIMLIGLLPYSLSPVY